MTLTPRQRTKINAALCLLHDNGHDAKAVIWMANKLTEEGQDPRSAYETALNTFLPTEPDIAPVVSKVLRLVDASDDGTVDQYDAALSAYVSTGDDTELNALAPMIAKDTIDLAMREGDITPEEAASGDVIKALGFEPGPALQEAAATIARQTDYDQPVQQGRPQAQQEWKQVEQSDLPQIGQEQTAPNLVNSSQVSPGSGATGYVARGAQRAWARETLEPGTEGYPTAEAQAA